MSRGAGHVERGIMATLTADPDNAFTVNELCLRVYPDINRFIEKKHAVAVIRATASLAKRWPDLGWLRAEMRGGTNIYFNAASVLSYAMSCMKGDNILAPYLTEEEMRASLRPGGKHHHLVVEGGAWRRHLDMWIAKRDGDTAALERLNAEQDESMAQLADRLGACLSGR